MSGLHLVKEEAEDKVEAAAIMVVEVEDKVDKAEQEEQFS